MDGKVLANAATRTVTKCEDVAVEANRVREIIRSVQPPIDIEFVGIFTKDIRQHMVTSDVDPDLLTF